MKSKWMCMTVAGLLAVAAIAQESAAPKAGTPVLRETPSLKVGDKAPPLSVAKWVKGSEVKEFQKGKFYVVEFWATWCGPCIVQQPHLTALQKEFGPKGVTIIAMTSEDPNNSLEKVEKMVKEKGDETMGFAVAWDTGRTTNEAYMRASGQRGIPCSFVVDGAGSIAWIGHPMWLDAVIEPLVAGKWDNTTGPKSITDAQAAMNEIGRKSMSDPKEALAALMKFEKDFPKVAENFGDMKLNLLLQAGEYDAAYAAIGKQVDAAIAKKDSAKLNQMAWMIVDPEGKIQKRDLNIAMKAAVKADEFTGGEDAAIIDTLARVHFLKGDKAKALELQTKAVAAAQGNMKAELEKTLNEYKEASRKND